MMMSRYMCTLALAASFLFASPGPGQEYGSPDRDQPGDEMIQQYLSRQAGKLHARFMAGIESLEDWKQRRERYKREYFHMLGLWPMPEKTAVEATVTGTLEGDGYAVDMLHYQSMPRLYVTGNLYRPKKVRPGERLPAVLYVCGHSYRGRNGNKTAYQSHGIWFARHGYICLVLDSLQLGEIGAIHHGTYREGRWWWHSRGYTPAGVECLNGMRGIDYLISREDVDAERIAVTGISGGGAATFWIAAADERARVAVPVSGMADLPSYVSNRVINGHCDCMFLYNTFQWPWTRIAGLIAPRAMLFVNSDADRIFPMDANRRVINRLERLYSLYGAGDFVDSLVSIGGHAYREDIRKGAYRFINMHLKNDAGVVLDSEADLVSGSGNDRVYPIPIEKLRVFPEDSDIPGDELNTTIDRHFVPMAQVALPGRGRFESWKSGLVEQLRRVSFRSLPERIEPARLLQEREGRAEWLETESGIRVQLRLAGESGADVDAERLLLVVQDGESADGASDVVDRVSRPGDVVYTCAPRGVGPTRWTQKNPPNYVQRSHVLLGQTADTGRVLDIIAAAKYLRRKNESAAPVYLAGEGAAGVLAAYAALWEEEIAGVIAVDPPMSHMEDSAPQFLNVLRVCDVPEVFGMAAPRPVTIVGGDAAAVGRAARIYEAAGASGQFTHESQ